MGDRASTVAPKYPPRAENEMAAIFQAPAGDNESGAWRHRIRGHFDDFHRIGADQYAENPPPHPETLTPPAEPSAHLR